jgi:hypothetical protein
MQTASAPIPNVAASRDGRWSDGGAENRRLLPRGPGLALGRRRGPRLSRNPYPPRPATCRCRLRPDRHDRHVIACPTVFASTRRAEITLVVTCRNVLAVDAHGCAKLLTETGLGASGPDDRSPAQAAAGGWPYAGISHSIRRRRPVRNYVPAYSPIDSRMWAPMPRSPTCYQYSDHRIKQAGSLPP